MPQAVQVLAAGVGLLIGGQGVRVALQIAAIALLNVISSKLFAPKIPSAIQTLREKQVMSRSATEYRKIVYGQAMVSGPIVYNNLSGSNGEYLWYVIALAQGEVEDFVSVWFDGDEIPKADIAWTAGTAGADGTGTGNVSTAKWVGANSTTAVQIQYYLGHANQVDSGSLTSAFADWTTSHRARGVAYLFCKLLYDADTEDVWKSGPPRDIKAVIKGRKIYDPRLDSTVIIDPSTSPVTMGSGAHRYTDATTWAWSDNPALCIADYLVNYMGADAATDINWPSIADAADDCDVSVVIPPATSPQTTESRFTCNGSLSLGESHKSNLDALVSSCDGHLAYSQGQWTLRAGVWDASTTSITEDEIVGTVTVRGSAPKNERANTIRGVFVDPDRKYSPAEFPHVTDASYVTRDAGDTISYDLELPMTNTQYMAQRIAFRQLEQFNNQIVVEFSMNLKGANIQVGQVFDLTIDHLSWAAKTFRCIGWGRNSDGTFKITGREDVSTAYDDPAIGDYTTVGSGATTIPSDVVPPPSSLAATGVDAGIKLTWTNPPAALFDYIEVYESATNGWNDSPMPSKVAEVRASTITLPHSSGTTRYYWIRAVRLPDVQSLRDPNNDTTTISATSSGAAAARITPIGASLQDVATDPDDAEVAFRVDADGDVYTAVGLSAAFSSIGTWLGTGVVGDYQCALFKDSGDDTTSGSALATWLACSSDRTWTMTETVVAGAGLTGSFTIKWRDATTLEVLGEATVDMTVDVEP